MAVARAVPSASLRGGWSSARFFAAPGSDRQPASLNSWDRQAPCLMEMAPSGMAMLARSLARGSTLCFSCWASYLPSYLAPPPLFDYPL